MISKTANGCANLPMANADPESSSNSSSEDEPVNAKSNGTVHSVDRYGFIGGKQYTNPDAEDIHRLPPEVLRKREIKWLDMFENWEKWMSKRFKKELGIPLSVKKTVGPTTCLEYLDIILDSDVMESNLPLEKVLRIIDLIGQIQQKRKVKDRCRKGIPAAVRARAWQFLCGSKFTLDHNRGKFESYLKQAGDPKSLDEITKDLHRQFPLHEMFSQQGGHGQEDLFLVLKAYTIHNPAEGYCQAHAPIAAVLLMHMPAEQAFWCLVSICEKYLPGYYSPGLEAIQLDGDVLFGLLKKTSPVIYKHLKKQRIEPVMYMTEWFMCIFTRNLPWSCVLRIWDMFLCEGVKVMFRVALVLIKINLENKLAECPSFYDTLENLRNIPIDTLDEELLTRESLKLNINERDMEKVHQRQIMRLRKDKEKSSKSSKNIKT